MTMSQSRPFTAATDKYAFAQAFAGPDVRRRRAVTPAQSRTKRGLLALRRFRRA